jgi:hypothetical protein
MTAKYLLNEVNYKKHIIISQRVAEDIPEFKTGKETNSLESLALILGGHSPIIEFNFDEKKVKTWCDENNLECYLDKKERLLHIRINPINTISQH